MSDEPMLTKRQRLKVHAEIMGLIGPHTKPHDAEMIRFVAGQVGWQTSEEREFCGKHDVRGRP